MTTETATETTISSRSRNLGYGWTNQPRQYRNSRGDSLLSVSRSTGPDVSGGLKTILTERARAQRGNAGNDWSEALFVAGRRIAYATSDTTYIYNGNSHASVGDIILALREGHTVAVRLEHPE